MKKTQSVNSRGNKPGASLTRGFRFFLFLAGVLCVATQAWSNGGPFVIKYPSGDPAAKGILARLDPDLKPARESRLAVISEDLSIRFEPERTPDSRGVACIHGT